MKRALFLFLILANVLNAWSKDTLQSGFGIQRYSIKANVEYGYNYTYNSYANFSGIATIPFSSHFEMEGRLQLSTANFYVGGFVLRPKIPFKVGELFFETRAQYNLLARNKIHETCAGLSLGYRMDYVSAQLGAFTRVFTPFNHDMNEGYGFTSEVYNIFWRLEVFVRPQRNKWNVSASIANNNDFQIERMWQPIFNLGGRYDIDEKWRVHADIEFKPTGMFHLNASFYSVIAKVGFTYFL